MLNFAAVVDPFSEQSLQVVLGGVPVAELAWVSSYENLESDDLTLITQTGVTTGATPVTVVSAPPAETDVFQLKTFQTKNPNAASVTFIVQYNDAGTLREILRVNLNQHDNLIYEQSQGWYVLDVSGSIKQTSSGLVVEESDLVPTYTGVSTVQFENADFVVSQPASGVAKIDLVGGGSATDNDARILAWILGNTGSL